LLKFIAKRLVQMAFLFFLFLSLVFFLLQAQPGDISSQFINPEIPAEVRAQILTRLGLDGSIWSQWWNYVSNFFRGNLGVSFSQYPQSVISVIGERIPLHVRHTLLIRARVRARQAAGLEEGRLR
jgi:peptide/nickel transport system permease protein